MRGRGLEPWEAYFIYCKKITDRNGAFKFECFATVWMHIDISILGIAVIDRTHSQQLEILLALQNHSILSYKIFLNKKIHYAKLMITS